MKISYMELEEVCTAYRIKMWPKFVALNRRYDLYFFIVIILALLHSDMSAVSGKPQRHLWWNIMFIFISVRICA
jgi:hypothetical protein